MLFDQYISIFYIYFSDLFYFEFSRKKYRLSSPKLILTLLLINQSKMLSNPLFSCFSIWWITLSWPTRHVSLYLTGCDISLIYMRKSRGPRIEPCGTSLDTHAGWENAFPKLTKKSFIYEIRSKSSNWLFRETNSIQFL